MRLGCTLPHLGALASPENLTRVAQRAEALGYHSLWVVDRLLYPLTPRTPYPASPDGILPGFFKIAMDPRGDAHLGGRADAADHARNRRPEHALL